MVETKCIDGTIETLSQAITSNHSFEVGGAREGDGCEVVVNDGLDRQTPYYNILQFLMTSYHFPSQNVDFEDIESSTASRESLHR